MKIARHRGMKKALVALARRLAVIRARYDYLLRQGTWNMMFGVGKTATSILNEAARRRNENFNNVVGAAKGAWCEEVKAFGIKHFGWGPLFEVGD